MTRKLTLPEFLGSLSIQFATESTFNDLTNQGFDTLDKVLAMTPGQFASAKTAGGTIIGQRGADIHRSLHSERLKPILANADLYLDTAPRGVEAGAVGGFKINLDAFKVEPRGLRVCMTGAGPIERPKLKKMLEALGMVVQSAVSSTTDFLILEDANSNTAKAKKARDHGTKLLSYDQVIVAALADA